MKTLDEVILAYELCSEGKCEKCPYRQIAPNLGYMPCDPTERESDVLHYLKAHKNQQDFYDDGIKRTTEMIDKCEKTVAEYLAVNNPPLLWQELKTMEGKPVWVEWTKSEESYWCFVGEWFYDDEMRIYRMGWDYADYIHKTIYMPNIVQAYRKERG